MADAPNDIGGHDPANSGVARIIDWSVKNQLLVLIAALALAIAGWMAVKRTPLDAIPDLTDTQVILRTEFPGQSPQIVEDLVTYPLSTTLLGLSRTKAVRGFSMFGTSFIFVVFEDGVDQYWARSRVVEALSKVGGTLPESARPQIGPDATGVGWIFQYALVDRTGGHDLAQLRSLQDWFVKFELATVKGVAEVASVGGFVKEYQVLVDPSRLRAYNVPLARIAAAVKAASSEVGGRVIERAETELVVRSTGYVRNLAELRDVVVFAENGTPVKLGDVARIVEGPELRRGIVDLNGESEVVGGIVVMRDGENALNVIRGVKGKLEAVRRGLPKGVEIVAVYDRAPLIEGAVEYLSHKLIEEAAVVAAGEAAAARVADVEGSGERGRDRSRAAADVEDGSSFVELHEVEGAVAGDAAPGLGGDPGSVVEVGDEAVGEEMRRELDGDALGVAAGDLLSSARGALRRGRAQGCEAGSVGVAA